MNEDDINHYKDLISSFRKEFQEFYGEGSMTYNCHSISHLPDCLENLGPLWNYSNFPFESNNGVLVGYVKSNVEQIFTQRSGICKINPILQKQYQTCCRFTCN